MKNINWPLGWETELFNVQQSHQAVVSQLFLAVRLHLRLRLHLHLLVRIPTACQSRVLRRIIHIRNLFNLPKYNNNNDACQVLLTVFGKFKKITKIAHKELEQFQKSSLLFARSLCLLNAAARVYCLGRCTACGAGCQE